MYVCVCVCACVCEPLFKHEVDVGHQVHGQSVLGHGEHGPLELFVRRLYSFFFGLVFRYNYHVVSQALVT